MLSLLVLLLTSHASLQEPSITSRPARLDAALAEKQQTLKTYDVRDIVAELGLDFAPPELGVLSTPRNSSPAVEGTAPHAPPTEAEVARRRDAAAKVLEELVRSYIEPKVVDPAITLSCSVSGTFVAFLNVAQHEWLRLFLEGLRDFGGLIEVRARFLTAPKGVLEAWHLTPSATLASEKDLEALLAQIARDGRFEGRQSPKISTQPTQRAHVSTVNQVAYVKGYSVQLVEPGPMEIADPEVAVILEGMTLDVRAAPLPGGVFGLALGIQNVSVKRPIRTQKIRVSSARVPEVEIGVPEVTSRNFSAKVLLASGASVVLVTADTNPEKDLAVIVTIKKAPRETGQPR